jgi:hypothetical protein
MLNGVRQLGFVAGDARRGAERWIAATGAGPFFLLEGVRFADWRADGAAQDMVLDIAFGQSGATMIEVIRPRGDWPCIYGDRPLAPDAMIAHHHGYLVPDPDAAAARLGLGTAAVSAALGPGTNLRYYDLRARLGVVVELIEDSEASRGFFDLARSAAEGWRGEDPLRTLSLTA